LYIYIQGQCVNLLDSNGVAEIEAVDSIDQTSLDVDDKGIDNKRMLEGDCTVCFYPAASNEKSYVYIMISNETIRKSQIYKLTVKVEVNGEEKHDASSRHD